MADIIQIVTLVLVSVTLGIILMWLCYKMWKKQNFKLQKDSDENYHYMNDKNLFSVKATV
jgi:predicted tellurium resistance membrane protein TerC